MSKKQSGFSAVEVILVVLVLGLIGVIGWLVWSRQTTPSTTTPSSSSSATEPTAVKITEWGLKITTSHASKLSYTIKEGSGYINPAVEAGDQYDAYAAFTAHDDAITDPDCSYPVTWMYRLKEPPEDQTLAVKIGDRYYTLLHPNGTCRDDASTDARDSLIEDLKLQNVSAL